MNCISMKTDNTRVFSVFIVLQICFFGRDKLILNNLVTKFGYWVWAKAQFNNPHVTVDCKIGYQICDH
jgi:hypothetical protein